jgi:hypothetical protein
MCWAVYEWKSWEGFLLPNIVSQHQRIKARVRDTPEKILRQLSDRVEVFLFHIDLSVTDRFPYQRAELLAGLNKRRLVILNASLTDITKGNLRRVGELWGLWPPGFHGPFRPDEMVIVKTAMNCGGEMERLLSPREREALGISEPHPDFVGWGDYRVSLASDVKPSWWHDSRLCIQKYVSNLNDIIYRVYVIGSRAVISEIREPGLIKKTINIITRKNRLVNLAPVRSNRGYRRRSVLEATKLVADAFSLEYGTIDIAIDDSGNTFVIDINTTPHWGTHANSPSQIDLITSLRGLVF